MIVTPFSGGIAGILRHMYRVTVAPKGQDKIFFRKSNFHESRFRSWDPRVVYM